jgi:hypothetical protein
MDVWGQSIFLASADRDNRIDKLKLILMRPISLVSVWILWIKISSVINHISCAEYLGFARYWLRLVSDSAPYLLVSNM